MQGVELLRNVIRSILHGTGLAGRQADEGVRRSPGGPPHRPPWVARFTSHIPPGQFARYLAVGLWNTVFGYSTFAALTALLDPVVPHSYIPASVLSNLLNITVAFLGYKRFVFRTQGHYLREWFRCMVVYGSGMAVGLAVLPVLVFALRHGAGLGRSAPYTAGALLTIVGVAYSFLGHRNYSFRSAPVPPPSANTEAAG